MEFDWRNTIPLCMIDSRNFALPYWRPIWFSSWLLAPVTFHISGLKDICDQLPLILPLLNSLVTMNYKSVFVFAIIQFIVLENVCNGQFHWAKHGNENARMKELIRELLRDDGSSYKVFMLYYIHKWAFLLWPFWHNHIPKKYHHNIIFFVDARTWNFVKCWST